METQTNNSLVKVDRAEQIPALKLSKVEFLKNFSPVKCLKQFQNIQTSLDCAQHKDLPTAIDLKLQYGEEYMIGYVKLWIINCFEYFDKKTPEGDRLDEGAIFCLDGRQYLNIADINLIFSSIKRTFADVTLPRIVKAFADYANERATAFYEKRLREDDVLKKHGYIPKKIEDIATKTIEAIQEHQLEQAKKEANLELMELNRQYHLQNILDIFNAKKVNK